MGINDYGDAADALSVPPLGGPTGWAAAVATALNGSDVTVNDRIEAALRVTHPNTDDVLAEQWDDTLGRWQTTHYDTGWRDVSSLLVNGWVQKLSNRARLRRVNDIVAFQGYLTAENATTDVPFTLPDGFAMHDTTSVWAAPTSAVADRWGPATVQASGVVTCSGARASSTSETIMLSVTGVTNAAIPTSLPGTLISPAPAV